MSRKVIPLKESFFNDGYWYVLSSTSLGGSNLSPAQIADYLQSGDEATMNQLLRDGIFLPLYFPGDCAQFIYPQAPKFPLYTLVFQPLPT